MGGMFTLPRARPLLSATSLGAGSGGSASAAVVSPAISAAAAAQPTMTLNQATVQGNSMSMPTSNGSDVHSTGWMTFAAFSSYANDLIPATNTKTSAAWAAFDGGAQGSSVYTSLYYNVQSYNGTFMAVMVSHTPNGGGKQYSLVVRKTGSPEAAFNNYPNSNSTILTQGTVGSGGSSSGTTGFTKSVGLLSTAAGTATAMLSSNAGSVASGYGANIVMGLATPQNVSVLGPHTTSGVQSTPPITDSELDSFRDQLSELQSSLEEMARNAAEAAANAAADAADAIAAAIAEQTASATESDVPIEDQVDALAPEPDVLPTATLSVADYSAKAGTTIPALIADSDNVRFDINSVNVFANAIAGEGETAAGIITDSASPLEELGISTNKIKILLVSDYDLGGEDAVNDSFGNPQLNTDPSVFSLNESFGYSRAKHGHIYNFFENTLFQNVELLIELEEEYKTKEAKLQKSIQYIREIDEFKAKFISELSDYNKSKLQYIGFMPNLNTSAAVRQAFFSIGQSAVNGGDYLVNRMNEAYETPTGLEVPEGTTNDNMMFPRVARYPDPLSTSNSLETSRPNYSMSISVADYSNSFVAGSPDSGIMKAAFGDDNPQPGIREDGDRPIGAYSVHAGKAALLRSVYNDLPESSPSTALQLANALDGDASASSRFLASIKRVRTDLYAGSHAATAAAIAQGQFVELLRSYVIATNEFDLTDGSGHEYAKKHNPNSNQTPLISDLLGDAGSQGKEFGEMDNTKKLAKLLKYPGLENTVFPFEKPSAKFAPGDIKPAVSGIEKWFDENIGNIFEDRPTDFRGLDTFAKEFQSMVESVENRVKPFTIEGHGQLFFNEAARAIRDIFSGELNETNNHPQASLSQYRLKGGLDFSDFVESEIPTGEFQPPMDPDDFEDLVDDMNDRDRAAADFADLQKEMDRIQNLITEDTVREGQVQVEEQLGMLERLQDQFLSYEGMLENGGLYEPFPGGPTEEDFLDGFNAGMGMEDLVGIQQGMSPQNSLVTGLGSNLVNSLEEPLNITNGLSAGAGVAANQGVTTDLIGIGINNAASTVTSNTTSTLTQGSNITSGYASSAAGYGTNNAVTNIGAVANQRPLNLFSAGAAMGFFNNISDMTVKVITEDSFAADVADKVSVAEAFSAGGLLDGENLSLAEDKQFFIRKIALIIEMLSNINSLSPHQFWYLCYNSTQGEVYSANFNTTGNTFNHTLIKKLIGTGDTFRNNEREVTQTKNGDRLSSALPVVKRAIVAHILELIHTISATVEKNMFFNIAAIASDAGISPRSAPADDEADILGLADVIFGTGARYIYSRATGRKIIAALGPKRVPTSSSSKAGRYTHLELRANVLLMLSYMANGIKKDLGASSNTSLIDYTLLPKNESNFMESGAYSGTQQFSRAYVRVSRDVNPIAIEAMAAKLILPLVDNVDPSKGPVKWKLTYGDWASSGFKLGMEDYVNRYVLNKTLVAVADEGLSAIPSGDMIAQNKLLREFQLNVAGHSVGIDESSAILNLVRLARHHFSFTLKVGDIVPYTFVDDSEIPQTAYAVSPPRGGLKYIIKGCVYAREDTRRLLAYLNRIASHYLEAKESMIGLKDDPNGIELFEHAKLPGVEAQEIIKYSSLRQTFLRSFIASEEAGLKSYSYLPSSNFVHPESVGLKFRNILNKYLKVNAKLTTSYDNLFDFKFSMLGSNAKNNRINNANRLIEEGKIVLLGMPDGLIDTGKSSQPRDVLERLVKIQEVCKHYFPLEGDSNIRPTYRNFWPALFINRANLFSAIVNIHENTTAFQFMQNLQYGTIDPDNGRYKIITFNDVSDTLEKIIKKKTDDFSHPSDTDDPENGYTTVFGSTPQTAAYNIIFNHVLSGLLKIYLDFYGGLNTAETSYSVNLQSNILYVDPITLENIDILLNDPNIAIESADVILDENVIVPFKEYFTRQTADSNIEVAYDRYSNFVAHTQMRLFSADQMATMTLVPNIFDRTFAVYSHFGQKRKDSNSPFFTFPEFDDSTSNGKVGNDFNAMLCFRSFSE